MTIAVHCAYDELVDPTALIPNPRNPNTHPDEQIRLLAKIIAAQGWRVPITVSNRSGFVVRGHGRLMAALALGADSVPVDRQDYATEADEWADLVADNRIAELAEINRPVLKDVLEELDTGALDMELTGFTDEALETLMSQTFQGNDIDEVYKGMPEFEQEETLGIRLIVHFKDEDDMHSFEGLIGQKIPGSHVIWHPAQQPLNLKQFKCEDES